ncbi:MAG: WD40 repeat domain-containing protein [Deltaproteobacteria bacterium]|nr:WD40 repeat domain-containing protein [Deltaproteobacteria bacterium]
MSRFKELLVDVDRWDRADSADQDAAIAELARQLDGHGFEWVSTQKFSAKHQQRPRVEQCRSCGGMGGSPPQSGNTDNPDCDTCENYHEETIYYDAEVASLHRVAVFRHRKAEIEFVLVPGRMEIAACLVARDPGSINPDTKLRKLTRTETRHVVMRAGAFDLAWDDGAWKEHPFGLRKADVASLVPSEEKVAWGKRPMRHPDRLAFTIADLEAAQATAYHELADELGPIDKVALPSGCLARTGCGTADPPRDRPHVIAFSRDGRWLATASSVGRDVRVWDVERGRVLSRLELSCDDDPQRVNSVAFSPDNVRLVVATNMDLEIFELTGQSLARLGKGLPSSRMGPDSLFQFSQRIAHWLANGDLLTAEVVRGTKDVFLSLIDPDLGEQKRSSHWKLVGSFWGIEMATSFAIDEGASRGLYAAVSIPCDGAIAIWDVERWESVRRIPVDGGSVNSLAIGGDVLFASLIGGEIRAYQISNGASFKVADVASSGFPDIAASADGTRVAWNHFGGVGICNVATRKLEICGRDTSTTPIVFSPNGTLCATGTSHNKIFAAIWPVTEGFRAIREH